MKNLKIAAILLLTAASANAQDLMTSQVPTDLNTSFQKAYPNATDVEWEMEGENYKVEFDMGKMDNEIWYSKDGNTIKTEMEITENDLPAAAKNTAQSKYPDYKIDEVEMTEENGKKTYEVELEKWFQEDIKLVISENGTLISERS